MTTFGLGLYTPPAVPDVLNVPLTRRDLLAVLAEAARQADQPQAREFYDALWQRFTVQWRQPE